MKNFSLIRSASYFATSHIHVIKNTGGYWTVVNEMNYSVGNIESVTRLSGEPVKFDAQNERVCAQHTVAVQNREQVEECLKKVGDSTAVHTPITLNKAPAVAVWIMCFTMPTNLDATIQNLFWLQHWQRSEFV